MADVEKRRTFLGETVEGRVLWGSLNNGLITSLRCN